MEPWRWYDILGAFIGGGLFGFAAWRLWIGDVSFIRTSRLPPDPPGRLNVLFCKWGFTFGAALFVARARVELLRQVG